MPGPRPPSRTPARPDETRKRRKAHDRGLSAENRAAWALRLTGWRILKRRYKTAAGEIDLIAKKRKTVAFIEVKARRTREEAFAAVTPASQKRIVRAARIFVAEHPKAVFFTPSLRHCHRPPMGLARADRERI
jgi:putative endonuclease